MVVIALLTCHNRREKTLRCLESLLANELPSGLVLHMVVVDAGSSDGTPDALQTRFEGISRFHLIRGGSDLFWSAGMRAAYEHARGICKADYLLYLNDDVVLVRDALHRLIALCEQARQAGRIAIGVGTTLDPESLTPTYGGRIRKGWLHRTQFDLVVPSDVPLPCETLNMNIALVPGAVAAVCRGIDRIFTHSMGDFDYGLRARQAGFALVVGPGYYGSCANDHDLRGTWRDPEQPLAARLRSLYSIRHLPFRPWSQFCLRHAGLLWPLYAVWPGIKVFATWLLHRVRINTLDSHTRG